jgi:hypothetical protein
MKGYFGPGVTCIYLDQFAASNILDQSRSELWQKIAELLIEKHQRGRLICPVPTEHFPESASKTKPNALAMDKRFHELGNGLAFKHEAVVTANHIISVIRHVSVNKDTYCDELRYTETLNEDGAFESFKITHSLLGSQVTEAAATQNELRKILSNKRFPKSVMEPMFQAIKMMQVRPFSDRLNELLRTGQIISRGVKFSTGEVIDWVDLVLLILLFEHKMTFQEGVQLRDLIDRTGFDQIPSLDIRITLTANLTVEHKKKNRQRSNRYHAAFYRPAGS